MTFQTPDLCDENEGKVKVATPMFQAYGGKTRFHGQIQTVKVFEDNVFVNKRQRVGRNCHDRTATRS